jgi:hypothetical protein
MKNDKAGIAWNGWLSPPSSKSKTEWLWDNLLANTDPAEPPPTYKKIIKIF